MSLPLALTTVLGATAPEPSELELTLHVTEVPGLFVPVTVTFNWTFVFVFVE